MNTVADGGLKHRTIQHVNHAPRQHRRYEIGLRLFEEITMKTLFSAHSNALATRTLFESILITSLAAALMTALSPPAQGAPRFIPMPPTFASGGVPQQVVTADVNKDGIPDLIASDDTG